MVLGLAVVVLAILVAAQGPRPNAPKPLWPNDVQSTEGRTTLAPRETFVPDDVEMASVVACGVHGNPDKTNDAFVIVGYERNVKTQYRAVIARRPGGQTQAIFEDCHIWLNDVERAILAHKAK